MLRAAHCWEAEDLIPRSPAMTAFRRTARLQQAHWRDDHGHPIGTQPYAPKPGQPARPVGSRIPLQYARTTGANMLSDAARAAARQRSDNKEPHQTFDHQRMWADLLSSEALAFNLFGDLAADLSRADAAVHKWFLDAPGTVCDVRFAHSPGRLDPSFLNSLRAFDAAFFLDRGDGTLGVVAVDVNYHERNKAETPRPDNLDLYGHVAERSRAFSRPNIARHQQRSDMCVLWLEHLLMQSMLQHDSGRWTWGRYLVVYPSGNVDVEDLTTRYRETLKDDTTFATITLEELLRRGGLPRTTVAAIRERYC